MTTQPLIERHRNKNAKKANQSKVEAEEANKETSNLQAQATPEEYRTRNTVLRLVCKSKRVNLL